MWRRAPFTSSMSVPCYSSSEFDSHAHSPRRRIGAQNVSGYPFSGSSGLVSQTLDSRYIPRATQPDFNNAARAQSLANEFFGDSSAYTGWLDEMDTDQVMQMSNRNSRKSNTDTSMPDYEPCRRNNNAGSIGHDAQFFGGNFRPEDDGYSVNLKVPTNTPTTTGQGRYELEGR